MEHKSPLEDTGVKKISKKSSYKLTKMEHKSPLGDLGVKTN